MPSSNAAVAPPSQGESLVRAMGTVGLAAAIINITIGGGIFRLPAIVAASLGPAAPLAYLVCAVAMGLIVLCIADAGSRVSLTGGPYAYVGIAFGRYVGFISGILLWMLGTFATAAVSTVFASSLGLLVSTLGGRRMEIGILVAAFAFWSIVNMRGVTLGVRLNSIATVAKLLPLLMVAIGGAFFIDPGNLQPGHHAGGRRRGTHVSAADFRVCRHRVCPGAERRSARHGAHRAAGDRPRHGGHHPALHRVAGGGAGDYGKQPGASHSLSARRCRRRFAGRLGALAAPDRRARYRCSAISVA